MADPVAVLRVRFYFSVWNRSMVGHKFIETLKNNDPKNKFNIVTFCEEKRAAYNRMRLTEVSRVVEHFCSLRRTGVRYSNSAACEMHEGRRRTTRPPHRSPPRQVGVRESDCEAAEGHSSRQTYCTHRESIKAHSFTCWMRQVGAGKSRPCISAADNIHQYCFVLDGTSQRSPSHGRGAFGNVVVSVRRRELQSVLCLFHGQHTEALSQRHFAGQLVTPKCDRSPAKHAPSRAMLQAMLCVMPQSTRLLSACRSWPRQRRTVFLKQGRG